MTQTIHQEYANTKEEIIVDVYYHPNSNAKENIKNGTAKHRYTVYARTFTKSDFIEYLKYADFQNAYINKEIKLMTDCFMIAAKKTGKEFIWKTWAENGHDDYGTFFATKEDAEADLYKQMC